GEHSVPVAPQFFGNVRIAQDLGAGRPTVALATQFFGVRAADLAFLEGGRAFLRKPYAAAGAVLRATLSGHAPLIDGLSYRLSATYTTPSRGAYVVGPINTDVPTTSVPELNPIDRFRVTIGLSYDFLRH